MKRKIKLILTLSVITSQFVFGQQIDKTQVEVAKLF